MHIDRLYDFRSDRMMYGIEVAKVGQRIGISSEWNFQTVILNGRASVSLECINLPNGKCWSILYGFVKIQKLVGDLSNCMDW